jgi:hypothetical protein
VQQSDGYAAVGSTFVRPQFAGLQMGQRTLHRAFTSEASQIGLQPNKDGRK